MLESLVDREKQTHKMLRAFLLQVIADSKESSETCQMMMLANQEGNAYFLASNSKGYVLDDDGKINIFSVRDIAGMMTYAAFGSIIEGFLSELIERIKEKFEIENKDVLMITYGNDAGCNSLSYFVNDKAREAVQVEFSEDKYLEECEKSKKEINDNAFFIFLKSDDDDEEI